MCVKTAINARLKKINRAINAIKEINRLQLYNLPTTLLFKQEYCHCNKKLAHNHALS